MAQGGTNAGGPRFSPWPDHDRSDVRFGKPCIRGHRITVQEILEWLSSGASQQQILADYPQLEPDDFLAVYAYAAELAAGSTVSRG
jgi:uncharacterized protein (DUF433 family)